MNTNTIKIAITGNKTAVANAFAAKAPMPPRKGGDTFCNETYREATTRKITDICEMLDHKYAYNEMRAAQTALAWQYAPTAGGYFRKQVAKIANVSVSVPRRMSLEAAAAHVNQYFHAIAAGTAIAANTNAGAKTEATAAVAAAAAIVDAVAEARKAESKAKQRVHKLQELLVAFQAVLSKAHCFLDGAAIGAHQGLCEFMLITIGDDSDERTAAQRVDAFVYAATFQALSERLGDQNSPQALKEALATASYEVAIKELRARYKSLLFARQRHQAQQTPVRGRAPVEYDSEDEADRVRFEELKANSRVRFSTPYPGSPTDVAFMHDFEDIELTAEEQAAEEAEEAEEEAKEKARGARLQQRRKSTKWIFNTPATPASAFFRRLHGGVPLIEEASSVAVYRIVDMFDAAADEAEVAEMHEVEKAEVEVEADDCDWSDRDVATEVALYSEALTADELELMVAAATAANTADVAVAAADDKLEVAVAQCDAEADVNANAEAIDDNEVKKEEEDEEAKDENETAAAAQVESVSVSMSASESDSAVVQTIVPTTMMTTMPAAAVTASYARPTKCYSAHIAHVRANSNGKRTVAINTGNSGNSGNSGYSGKDGTDAARSVASAARRPLASPRHIAAAGAMTNKHVTAHLAATSINIHSNSVNAKSAPHKARVAFGSSCPRLAVR